MDHTSNHDGAPPPHAAGRSTPPPPETGDHPAPALPATPGGGALSLHLGIFLVSLSVLAMEILQTRLFSLMLWHHVTYFVVTITLLGFAASGTLMAIFPGLYRGDTRAKASVYALLFGLTTLATLRLLAWLRPETLGDKEGSVDVLSLFFSYFYLIVPYVFAGLSIGVLLKEMTGRVGNLYATNLVGSGAGCFLFVLAIAPLGGGATTLVITALAGLGALALAWGGRCKVARGAALVGTLVLAAGTAVELVRPEALVPIPVAGSKLMTKELEVAAGRSTIETTRWSPLCRIDVVKTEGKEEERRVYQDGDAPTTIWSGLQAAQMARVGHYESFFYGLGYLTKRGGRPRVLIIGPGGGVDVENALHFGASRVAAVEINPETLRMVREDYREYTAKGREHGIYDFPAVEPINSEGRAWMRKSDERFDIIQMTGTDTYAALASGAYVFSESYLYTVEAFQEYLDHLTEDGVVAVLRFRFEPARESLKLAAIAARALEDRGVEDPARHIIVINVTLPLPPEYRAVFGLPAIRYAITLTKRSPWKPEEVRQYWEWIAYTQKPEQYTKMGFGAQMGHAPAVGDTPAAGAREYLDFFAAARKGEEQEFFESYTYDVAPIHDNNPFFFKFHKWSDILGGDGGVKKIDYEAVAGREPIGLIILLSLLGFVTAAVLVLVLFPLLFLKRQGAATQRGRVFVYFFGIGLGFIFAEIASLQRFVLFLGHPTYSLTVVLCGFLVFMGLGSLVSQRLKLATNLPTRVALGSVIAILVVQSFVLPGVFKSCLHLGDLGRMAVAAACIAPLALCMGFAFPTGMRLIDRINPGLVPWAWGVNGAASVTGSVVAIILAMAGGFDLVLYMAGICYLAALLLAPRPQAA